MNEILKDIVLKTSPGLLAAVVSKGKWVLASHLQFIDNILQASCLKGLPDRIIINMPPRHGKSELISKYFPFWHLLNYPDKRILLCSYSASFAQSWGRKVRDLINMHGGAFDIEINKSSKAAGDFSVAGYSGGMSCAGAGGPITGKGADLLIIDDPVKNDAEAHSPVYREKIWEWFRATAMTRLEPGGVVVIIMTRWHEDDLCGRIIQSEDVTCKIEELEKGKWLSIVIPALAEENDILGRKQGEALWKDRFSGKKLEEIRKSLGEYWFSALYMQKPSPAGGGIFKKADFRYFTENDTHYLLKDGSFTQIKKESCRMYAVMDLAAGISETSDFTVILVFAAAPLGQILILDILRERFSASEHLSLLKKVFQRWNPGLIGIESVQYQIALVQAAMKKGYPVMKLKPDKDKISRALPMAARCETGDVYFRENSSWLEPFESELLAFPNARHDDQVDTFAYISYMLNPVSNTNPAGIPKKHVFRSKISDGFI